MHTVLKRDALIVRAVCAMAILLLRPSVSLCLSVPHIRRMSRNGYNFVKLLTDHWFR